MHHTCFYDDDDDDSVLITVTLRRTSDTLSSLRNAHNYMNGAHRLTVRNNWLIMHALRFSVQADTNGVVRKKIRRGLSFFVWDCGASGAKRPRARPKAVLGKGAGRGSPPPAMGVRGITPGNYIENFDAK